MITFKEDTHEYFNGDKKLISVTQLMRKHGLAPNYDGVPSEILRAKAERGTLIHKEIEEYLKGGQIGFTSELEAFMDYIKNHEVKPIESERVIYNDIVAGTVDLVLLKDGEYIVADIKTTAKLHKEAVSWQLSIYAYLYFANLGTLPTRGQAYHFKADGSLQVVDIPLKSTAEIHGLIECERKGELYKQELTVQDSQLARLVEVETLIKQIEEQKKVAEAQATELRTAIMQSMEDNGLQTFETDRIKLTYVAPTTRTAIDSTRLKKEMPEIAEKYTKTSNVKASLRVTLKEQNNDKKG